MPEVFEGARVRHLDAKPCVLPHHVLLAVALALTFAAYCRTIKFDFVYDDHLLIVENPILRSWRFVPRYFTQDLWASIDPDELGNYYRPVFLLWLRLNYVLFGLAPWGWHLTTILVHLGVTLLVYWLASKIVGDRLTGALAALIFGVHPVHVEPVAWACGVIDPIVTALFIASFLCYLRQREMGGEGRGWAGASLLLYAVAMLAKENALVLPLILFAYEWIFGPRAGGGLLTAVRGERIRQAIKPTVAYLALTVVYLPARVIALKGLSHALTPLPLSTTVFTWPSLVWFYLRLLVWPLRLSPCYDTPYVTNPGSLGFVVPTVGMASVAILLWAWARKAGKEALPRPSRSKSHAITLACVWLIITTVPLLNLSVFPKDNFAHDRYLYLPSVGFAVLVALGLRSIELGERRIFGVTTSQLASTIALGLLLVSLTAFQTHFWQTDLLLYSRAVTVAPNDIYLKTNLANAMVERNLNEPAINLYQQVLSGAPDFWWANFNLGYTYYKMGKLNEAEWWLKRAISIYPYKPNEFLYLGLTSLRRGDSKRAEEAFRQAIRVRPDATGGHLALGMALKLQGNLSGALEQFKAELALNPDEPAARDQITEVEMRLRDSGHKDSALEQSPSRFPSSQPQPTDLKERRNNAGSGKRAGSPNK